jgi:Glycosyltransferase family 87
MKKALAGICLGLLTLAVWWLIHPPHWMPGGAWPWLMACAWALFALGFASLLWVPVKACMFLILLGGLALPLAAGFSPPRSSDDMYRYVWDGRVQTAGIDPYRYAPAAPRLAGLRDGFLWPEKSSWCVPSGATDFERGEPLSPGCTLINRPHVHTVYPPVAQGFFTLVDLLSPNGSREGPMQLAAALTAFATTIMLLICLPRIGLDPRLAALWAWCPLIALEAGNNAHIDVLASFLTGTALVLLAMAKDARRAGLGGVIFGLAIAVKITPALVAPALLRKRPFLVGAAVLFAIGIVYLPHLVAVGWDVFGYLPGYVSDEGYSSGQRFALIGAVVPTPAAPAVAVAILAVTAFLVWRRTDPDRPWRTAIVMVGVAFLVTTPPYAWYSMLVVLLVAFTGRVEWLALCLAGYAVQYSGALGLTGHAPARLAYAVALVVIVGAAIARHATTAITKQRAGPLALSRRS